MRVLFIFPGGVSFHYDMARDAYVAQQILGGDLKILGPPTSTPGLFHGVFYYYLIAPFYWLGGGDPRIPAYFLSFLNSLIVIPIVILARELFKSVKWAFVAGLLFVVAFEATQYGPWLSNPGPAAFTMVLFFWGLWIWQKGQINGLYLAAVSAALSTQFQLFLIYSFALILIFKFLFKAKINLKQFILAALLSLFSLSTFIISAVKFGTVTQVIGSLASIPASSQFSFRIQFSDFFLNYVNRFVDIFINNFLPTNVFLGGVLAFFVLYFVRKNKFILFGLLSNILIFIFGGHSSAFANVGMITPAILAMVLFLQKVHQIQKSASLLLILVIVISNIYILFNIGPKGQLTLVIPKDMVLDKQLKLIDKSYELSEGQPFSINTLTLPLWTNTTWAYLYSWYGKSKYGYVPSFYGHDQVGLLGQESLSKADKPLDKTFFIIEPHVGIPEDRFHWEIGSEDSKTELIKEIQYGELKLQFRKPKIDEQ